jgi:uncharacterized protein
MAIRKIELEIIALSNSVNQNHSYAVVLGEKMGARRIPIIIGSFEAQAIAIALERVKPSRPLTHDLFKNTLVAFGISLKEIFIYKLEQGIFYSRMICQSLDGDIEIDSRTSDAVAMAARFNAPMYTTEQILINAGLLLDETESDENVQDADEAQDTNLLQNLTMNELEQQLSDMLEQEDYHAAALIRDELKRRKK